LSWRSCFAGPLPLFLTPLKASMTTHPSLCLAPSDVQRIASDALTFALADFGDSPGDLVSGLVQNFEALLYDAAHAAGVPGMPECFRGAALRMREGFEQGVVA